MPGSAQLGSPGARLGELVLGAIYSSSNTITIALSDTISVSSIFDLPAPIVETLSDTLTPTTTFSINRDFNRAFTNILVPSSILSLDLNSPVELPDILVVNDFFTLAGDFTHFLSDTLTVSDGSFNQKQDNLFISIPSWIVITDTSGQYLPASSKYVYLQSGGASVTFSVRRRTTLESPGLTIAIDSPNFGDLQSNVSDMTVSRAVGGAKYTYIKSTKRRKLKYEFNVRKSSIDKCDIYNQLISFIDQSYLDWITLINWKGEVWFVRLINDNVIFTGASRDMYTVTLEFEGYLSTPGNYKCLE